MHGHAKHFSRRGFTLIELLVVISIIGLLASVVLTNLSSAREKAVQAKRIAEVRAITDAIEAYAIDNGEYPRVTSDGTVVPGESITRFILPYLTSDSAHIGASLQDYRYTRQSANSYGLLLVGSQDDPCLAGDPNAWGSGAQDVQGC